MRASTSKPQLPRDPLFKTCKRSLFQILAKLLWQFAFHSELNLKHRKPCHSNWQLAQCDVTQYFKTAVPKRSLVQNCGMSFFKILAKLLWHFAFHPELNLKHRKACHSDWQLAQCDEWQYFKTAVPSRSLVQNLLKVIVSNPGQVIVTICFPPWIQLEAPKSILFQLPVSSVGWAAVLQNRSSLNSPGSNQTVCKVFQNCQSS